MSEKNIVSTASLVNFDNLKGMAEYIAKSGMVPQSYKEKPQDIVVAIMHGQEIGLAPLQSLSSIAVIQGKPTLWGDAMLALCQKSSLLQDVVETIEGEGDTMVAKCIVQRKGYKKPHMATFSVDDAKKAGLIGKDGQGKTPPWNQYRKRMLTCRARAFALRSQFADVLGGFYMREEIDGETVLDITDVARHENVDAGETSGITMPGEIQKAQAEERIEQNLGDVTQAGEEALAESEKEIGGPPLADIPAEEATGSYAPTYDNKGNILYEKDPPPTCECDGSEHHGKPFKHHKAGTFPNGKKHSGYWRCQAKGCTNAYFCDVWQQSLIEQAAS